MTYFNYDGKITINAQFQFKGEEVNHILKSRRIRKGEKIDVQDCTKKRYEVVIDQIIRKKILATATCQLDIPSESNLKIQVFQAIVKEKATDNIIQKLTELGCWKLIFFQSIFSQKLHQENQLRKKLDRWQRISVEACKQCNRMHPLQIGVSGSFKEVLKTIQDEESGLISSLFLDIGNSDVVDIKSLTNTSQINLIIGPEGGWHSDEKKMTCYQSLQLGPRILRADTAAISATAILQHLYGDLN